MLDMLIDEFVEEMERFFVIFENTNRKFLLFLFKYFIKHPISQVIVANQVLGNGFHRRIMFANTIIYIKRKHNW
jgi:hypothetical protein